MFRQKALARARHATLLALAAALLATGVGACGGENPASPASSRANFNNAADTIPLPFPGEGYIQGDTVCRGGVYVGGGNRSCEEPPS